MEHRKVSDLLRLWEERVQRQAQHFETFASQVVHFDTEIIANAAKIKALTNEHAQLKARQDTVDQSIQQIWDQQDSLSRLLSSLQDALQTPAPQAHADEAAGTTFGALVGYAGPSSTPPVRAHLRAQALTLQLDELDRQAEDLARETGNVQSVLYTEPLTTVVRVLDAHASALDSLQAQVGGLAQRLRTVETLL